MIPDASDIETLFMSAVRTAMNSTPRSKQAAEGKIGPSDLGFCRERTRLRLAETPESDPHDLYAAWLGTVLDEAVQSALFEQHPDWLFGTIHGEELRSSWTFPNGASIDGIPDIVIPEWNAVIDNKSKDGVEYAALHPWTMDFDYQVWPYAKGLAKRGILDPDKPLHVGLAYWDRAGGFNDRHLAIAIKEIDLALEDEISQWIDDVIYAHTYGEEASKDIAPSRCAVICPFFTVCRGQLPVSNDEPTDDPAVKDAIRAYVDASADERQARKVKEAAREELAGINATVDLGTGLWQVRWTHSDDTFIQGYMKRGGTRIDVSPVKGRR